MATNSIRPHLKSALSTAGVSIIICCFNSGRRIADTLSHIARQILSNDIKCEIILVDNASTDNTRQVAEAFWATQIPSSTLFKVVDELTPGLSQARKKGIEASNYEYLIFCDDDNWLDEHYIANVVSLFQQDLDVAILGGLGTAVFETQNSKPAWFDRFYHSYAVGEQATDTPFKDAVYGAGMSIRRSVLQHILAYHTLMLDDRKKGGLSSGGDTELCLSVRLSGHKVLYSPQLKFGHLITDQRLTWEYLRKLHIGFAKSNLVINLYQKALDGNIQKLSGFYWLKRCLYYLGIYIKYSFKYSKTEFSEEEIRLLTWRTIAVDLLMANFKTVNMFSKIVSLKDSFK